jgi:LysR family transcriptional regulator, transcriptional activator of the cysJI operon
VVHIETLQTFCNLVETGNFGRAARLGFISQSAVSQQLKALETRYNRPLIERGSRRGLALTEAGRLFYAECRELLDRFCALEERMREPTEAIGGTIRLATVYSIGLHELPPYVTRFMRAYPRVKVHIEYSRTDKIWEDCQENRIDFGIVAFPLRRFNGAVIPWRQEKLVLVCAPTHSLARRRRVRLAQLRGAAFIAFERDIPTRKTIDKILKGHGVAVDTVVEFDNIETIKRAVEVGSGLSILPDTTVINEVKRGLLATVDFAEGPFTRDVGIIHRRGRVLSAAASEFVKLLVAPASS